MGLVSTPGGTWIEGSGRSGLGPLCRVLLLIGLLVPLGAVATVPAAASDQADANSTAGPTQSRWVELDGLEVDREGRALRLSATLQVEAFLSSAPPDHQYHALVHREGGAAAKSLFVTDVSDRLIARHLRELGAEDGGGVPMAAWNLRWVPLVPQPDRRVQGSPVQVLVEWDGASRAYTLEELLDDRAGDGIEIRFGGNEEHDHHWESGCILCLFSCPGGVLSNATYTIRDHQRGTTTFDPGDRLPPDGTDVIITFTLDSS